MIIRKTNTTFWILLAGSVWGIVEGTAGWIIHLFHIHHLTPLLILTGVICMMIAVIKTKRPEAAFKVAGVTAVLKLTNLFLLTHQPLSWVLAPVIHILSEGLIVALILYCAKAIVQSPGLRYFSIYNKRK